jgi:aspartate racemase
MKTVGIIGGLGPETTSKFYLEVVFSCYEKDRVNRPPMLIWNVPLPYNVEERFITQAQGVDEYLPYLIDAAKRLEKGGADFIVIPCNSVHILIDRVRESVNIPVLSIVEETVNFLKQRGSPEVGILATQATIRKKLYENKLAESGITVKVPHDEDQDKMGQIINNLVHSRHDGKDKRKLLEITNKFVQSGTNTILLACTDLQLITPEIPNTEVIDTMEILVQATVREILERK